MALSIIGGAIISLICMRHIDIKLLIASSSVVHIRACIRSIFMIRDLGQKGCVFIIVAHGLASSGLFFIAARAYSVTSRRSLLVTRGLIVLAPAISLWWFLLRRANIAAPPSLNLFGEICLLSSLLR